MADLATLYGSMPDRAIREQLIFVYSQSDEPAAVDKLLEIARKDSDPELRKKALFWLGQSNDPRALTVRISMSMTPRNGALIAIVDDDASVCRALERLVPAFAPRVAVLALVCLHPLFFQNVARVANDGLSERVLGAPKCLIAVRTEAAC